MMPTAGAGEVMWRRDLDAGAVAGADACFTIEGPALAQWTFDAGDGMVPVEPVEIAGATHMLLMVQPPAVAAALRSFVSRHRM
jgi:pimeloyl-ACP methyl ester carboxylesterase